MVTMILSYTQLRLMASQRVPIESGGERTIETGSLSSAHNIFVQGKFFLSLGDLYLYLAKARAASA